MPFEFTLQRTALRCAAAIACMLAAGAARAEPAGVVTIGAPQLRGAMTEDAASSESVFAGGATQDFQDPDANGSDPRTLSPDDEAALREALATDPLAVRPAAKRWRTRPAAAARLGGSRTDHADGSATVTLNRPLATAWDTRIGADLGLAATPPRTVADTILRSEPGHGSGAAWASLAVPGVAALDARVDPAQDHGSLGATFRQSLPLGDGYALTVRNRYGVTESFGASAIEDAASPRQVWTTDREVRLDILSSGTTLTAGTTRSSAESGTRGAVSARQRVAGPLSITSMVSDVGAPVATKSITADFRLTW